LVPSVSLMSHKVPRHLPLLYLSVAMLVIGTCNRDEM
jgi:hypothetical protein